MKNTAPWTYCEELSSLTGNANPWVHYDAAYHRGHVNEIYGFRFPLAAHQKGVWEIQGLLCPSKERCGTAPVLSGHQIALVYQLVNNDPDNLLLTKTPPENAEVLNKIANLLESLLAPEWPSKLVYDLKEECDESEFVKEGPKGRDQVLANIFCKASTIRGKFNVAYGQVRIQDAESTQGTSPKLTES